MLKLYEQCAAKPMPVVPRRKPAPSKKERSKRVLAPAAAAEPTVVFESTVAQDQ